MAVIGRRRRGQSHRHAIAFAGVVALAGAFLAAGLSHPASSAYADPAQTFQTIPTGDYPISVILSADGHDVYVLNSAPGSGQQTSVQVFNASDLSLTAQNNLGTQLNATAFALTSDESQLWVTEYEPGDIQVLNPSDLSPTSSVSWTAPSALVASGTSMFVGIIPGYLRKWSTETPPVDLAEAHPGGGVRGLEVSADGSTLFAAALDQGFFAYPIAAFPNNPVNVPAATLGIQPWAIGLNPAQDRIYLAGAVIGSPNVSRIVALDASTYAVQNSVVLPAGCGPRNITTSDNGNRVYIACLNGNFATYDYTTGESAVLPFGTAVESVAVHTVTPGGDADRVYVTSGGTNQLLVFDKPTVDGFTGVADQTVQEGATAAFNVEPNNFWQRVQWQSSVDGGSTWTDIPDATSTTLSVNAGLADDGTLYRLVSNSDLFDPVASEPMKLTVTAAPTPAPGPCPTPTGGTPPPCLAPTGSDLSGPLVGGAVSLLVGAVLVATALARRTSRRRV